MARNNIHELCRHCYETMKADRRITFAGGKTRKGVCASCGNRGNVARYNVDLEEMPTPADHAANGEVTTRRELPPDVRERIREKIQDAVCQPAPDVDKSRVMIALHVDPRTCNALAHMARNWGKSMDETADIVVARYRKSLRARYLQRGERHD